LTTSGFLVLGSQPPSSRPESCHGESETHDERIQTPLSPDSDAYARMLILWIRHIQPQFAYAALCAILAPNCAIIGGYSSSRESSPYLTSIITHSSIISCPLCTRFILPDLLLCSRSILTVVVRWNPNHSSPNCDCPQCRLGKSGSIHCQYSPQSTAISQVRSHNVRDKGKPYRLNYLCFAGLSIIKQV